MPLGLYISSAGTHEIKLAITEGLFADQNIFLEDQLTGVIHDLKSSAYSFESAAGTFNDRFRLRYIGAALGNPDHIVENIVIVYKNLDEIVVNTGNMTMSEVHLFDMSGRRIASKTDINATETRFNIGAVHQPLIARIISVDGTVTIKKLLL